ncbi:Predicted unusual protein kinase regulating ubiquinone biosynthesis, AarF/ABC1/UbiB family [Actinopolyspora saharensis]|uniref:Predicted unusual protein kinase regulating ubiquinone biosynthesis, AarF/ABC1/UbiB family n=2 Tax=Actinopolyspora saharensis TaxID=995062 RepID=A0A1H0ZLR1_9ACTN|nr:Predicted unusual protein kinase regulating ubiquinone biosynthesis, AarF/ABC1/UbiB family [Actinopolyspora saharensis]
MSMHRLRLVSEVLGGLFANEVSRAFGGSRGLGSDADPVGREQQRAREVRRGLERLGPFYIKVGQILSTRPDIVPPTMIGELEKLHDRVSALPFSHFEPVLEEELGPDWKERFLHVEMLDPLGVASLAQVYAVTLRDGRPGVIKIQRPGIRDTVTEDMRMMRRAARMFGRCAPRFNAVVDVEAMLGVLFDAMRPELDFTVEASHMDQARKAVQGFRTLSVPDVEFCTPRVLVQSLAPGKSIGEIDRAQLPERERLDIGEELLSFTYRGFFVDRMFHADPHPGNIFVQPGGQASLIDWGMVGRVDRRTSLMIMLVLLNIAQNDGYGTAKAWIDLGYATPWADVTAFMSDMSALTPKISSASLEELNFGVTLTAVLERSTKRGIKTNPVISVLGKAFGNIEGSVRCLAPELSLTGVFQEQMKRIMLDLAGEHFSLTQAARTVTELMLGVGAAPEQARTLARDLSNRDFGVNIGKDRSTRSRPDALSAGLLSLGGAALWLQNRRGNRS